MSRPAVSRHLRVRCEAELVRGCAHERESCLELGALAELEAFLRDLRAPSPWHRRFDALETEVQRRRKRRHAADTARLLPDQAPRRKETA